VWCQAVDDSLSTPSRSVQHARRWPVQSIVLTRHPHVSVPAPHEQQRAHAQDGQSQHDHLLEVHPRTQAALPLHTHHALPSD
jgi:hypothetical protein